MTKYASERIWRTPDGKLVAEGAVPVGVLGTVLAYAQGDAIEGDEEEGLGKLASAKAPTEPNSADLPKPPAESKGVTVEGATPVDDGAAVTVPASASTHPVSAPKKSKS